MNDANQNQDSSRASKPLPACLEKGGRLDVLLSETRGAASGDSGARVLHQEMVRDVEELRHTQNRPDPLSDVDGVLRYCVARDEGRRDFEESAYRKYVRQASLYDLVLGDFIPKDLQDLGRRAVEQESYAEDTNATAAEDWNAFVHIERSEEASPSGLPTGLRTLDAALGGLRGLAFLGGNKGVGKTALATSVAVAVLQARSDVGVLLYSLDMDKTQIYKRMHCSEAKVDYRTLTASRKSPEQRSLLAEASERLRRDVLPRLRVVKRDFAHDATYDDDGNQQLVRRGLTRSQIQGDCLALMNASGVSDLLLVVDLFQKIDPPGHVADGLPTDKYRLDLLDQIRQWSSGPERPHGFPILITSEIRKGAIADRLSFDDLKGSGQIASDADVVMLMMSDAAAVDSDDSVVPVILRIDKGREGVCRRDVKLWFQYDQFRFFDEEPREEGARTSQSIEMDDPGASASTDIDPLGQ